MLKILWTGKASKRVSEQLLNLKSRGFNGVVFALVDVDSLLKLQFRVMSPRTTLEQIPVLSSLLYHSGM